MVAVLYLGQNPEVQTRCVCYVVIMESRHSDVDWSYCRPDFDVMVLCGLRLHEYKTIKGGGKGRL